MMLHRALMLLRVLPVRARSLNRTQRAQLFAQVLVLVNNSFIKARFPRASMAPCRRTLWLTRTYAHLHTRR
jgi:hypothetical protein